MTEPIAAGMPQQMPEPGTQVPPPGAPVGAIVTALVAALIAGAPVMLLARILGRLPDVTRSLAEAVLTGRDWGGVLTSTGEQYALLPRDRTPGVRVLHEINTVNSFRRASYLVNATRRLAPAYASGDQHRIYLAETAENRYQEAHRRAESVRIGAAAEVAALAAQFGVDRNGEILLGWRATLDEVTSIDCRWAHRKNFDALRIPPIGYPGMVHLTCRCKPRPPWDTDARMDRGTPPTH